MTILDVSQQRVRTSVMIELVHEKNFCSIYSIDFDCVFCASFMSTSKNASVHFSLGLGVHPEILLL